MNKKLIIIVVGFLITLILLNIALSLGKTKRETPSLSPSPTITATPRIPRGNIMTVSGVTMNNIYNNESSLKSNGELRFLETPKYHLIYSPPKEYFLISIVASPFPESRKEAETAFLNILGITQDQACRLNVNVTTPLSVNPDYAGNAYRLSFCK